jgi:hypothetical protein
MIVSNAIILSFFFSFSFFFFFLKKINLMLLRLNKVKCTVRHPGYLFILIIVNFVIFVIHKMVGVTIFKNVIAQIVL